MVQALQVENARSRWTVRLLLCLILFLACGIPYWLNKPANNVTVPDARLFIDEKLLDFDEVWKSDSFTWQLVISNRSKEDIHILDFITSCTCASVEPRSLTIPTGESATVNLMLDLTVCDPTEDQLPLRSFEAHIVPGISLPGPIPRGWTVRGRVRSAVVLTPPSVDFEDTVVHGLASKPRLVSVKPFDGIANVRATCDPLIAKVDVRSGIRNAADAILIEITPRSGLPEGAFRTNVRLEVVAADGTLLPPLRLPVQGTVVKDLQVLPTSVSLGAHALGETVIEMITLQSASGRPFQVEGVESPSDIEVQSIRDRSPSRKAFKLAVRIQRKGMCHELVKFLVRSQDDTLVPILLDVTYFGIVEALTHNS